MFSLFSQRTARTAYLSTSRSVSAKGTSRLQTREQLPRCPIRLTSHQFSSSSPQHARYSRFSSSSDEQKSWSVSLETRLAAVGAGCAALYIVFQYAPKCLAIFNGPSHNLRVITQSGTRPRDGEIEIYVC